MKFLRLFTASVVAVPLIVSGASRAQSTLLYDVDFSSPPHVVGQPPVVGDGPAPRVTPSQIGFGEPLVVSALGALADQPCAFGDHPDDPYDQLKFHPGQGGAHGFPDAYPMYHIEMDLLLQNMGSGDQLKIYVDAPIAHSVQFNAAGEIRVSVLGEGGYNVLLGSYTSGVPLLLAIDADIANESWTIFIDGDDVFTGAYPSTSMSTVRFSMSCNAAADPVAIDNVRIYGGAPPACPADVNSDGAVDVLDLLAVLAAWGGGGVPEDVNGDGLVDVLDLLAVLAAWGPC